MTAILGVFHSEKSIDLKDDILQAFKKLSHRGIEDQLYYSNDYISLVSSNPILRENLVDFKDGRYFLTFSGNIYNFDEIKKDLGREDISLLEGIGELYDREGEKALNKLRGYYSLLIWDEEKKSLFLARDNFGISPLYYQEEIIDGKRLLYFASEKKALLELKENLEIDKESLQDYFSYRYVPEGSSMHKNIKRLLAGHFLLLEEDKPLKIDRHWKPVFKERKSKEEDLLASIKNALVDSVRAHMKDDKDIGCLLSSGIDSTIMAAIAKDFKSDIHTYTVYFDQGYSELDVAAKTADILGLKNIPVEITAEEYMKIFPQMVYHMDDPLSDESAIGLYFASKAAKKDVGILLSGEGSDELFTGYKLYKEPILLGAFNYIPGPIRRPAYRVLSKSKASFRGKNTLMRGMLDLEDRHFSNTRAFEDFQEIEKLMREFDPNKKPIRLAKKYYDESKGMADISRMQYVDLHLWSTGDILLKADRMNRANGIEVRMPFLDRQVFEVARGLDPKRNVSNKTTKYLLRQAMKGIVPEHVINRPKLGFPVPLGQWLKDEMYDWAMNIIKNGQVDEYLNKEYIYKLYEDHLSNRKDNRRELWACITFILWHQIYMEGLDYENL